MFEKAFITGGAGFIGSHIGSDLIKKGKEVVIYDNLSVGKKENVPKGAKFIKGDILDPRKLEESMRDCDIVFHNAAFVSVRGSFSKLRLDLEANCIGTLNVFEAAVNVGVKKLVFASSMAVYGHPESALVNEDSNLRPNSFYGLSKLRGEKYAKLFEQEYGLKSVCLRYFNTFGVKQTLSPYVGVISIFINNVLKKKPMIIFGDGDQTRDFVWVEDVAKANLLVSAESNRQIFNVGGGKSYSISNIAQMIQEKIGGEITYGPIPHGEIRHITADISKIKKELGYSPKGSLEKELGHIIEWWKKKI